MSQDINSFADIFLSKPHGEKIRKKSKPQQCDICAVIKIIISESFVLFHYSEIPDLYFWERSKYGVLRL